MKYLIKTENEIIEGATAKELALALKKGSKFASEENLSEYMRGFAQRYEELTGQKLAYNNSTNFINSLLAVGYLEPIED